MSTLRARCPDCRTLTAVAIDAEYQCHSCGREFAAGLVRVPAAWGAGGETMAAAAWLELPYPEAAIVESDSLEEQIAVQSRDLPVRPLVLGGCCCAHVGAIRGLAARPGRLGVVWIDAHGDLNTPGPRHPATRGGCRCGWRSTRASSVPRTSHRSAPATSTLPKSPTWMRPGSTTTSVGRSRAAHGSMSRSTATCYGPGELDVLMPEPGGSTGRRGGSAAAERRRGSPLAGLGLTGLTEAADPTALTRLAAATGL